jgi:hypothetical protein
LGEGVELPDLAQIAGRKMGRLSSQPEADRSLVTHEILATGGADEHSIPNVQQDAARVVESRK